MSQVILRPDDFHWIDRADDNPSDQCAHGEVELTVGAIRFVEPAGGDWNLTAAGLFLLRTMTDNNTPSETVCPSNFLIPCCGFNPWLVGTDKYPLVIQGCNRGINISVEHKNDGIQLNGDNGKVALIASAEWRDAVLGFVGQIEDWYARNPPRAEPGSDLDARGWEALWHEWKSRSEAARIVASQIAGPHA